MKSGVNTFSIYATHCSARFAMAWVTLVYSGDSHLFLHGSISSMSHICSQRKLSKLPAKHRELPRVYESYLFTVKVLEASCRASRIVTCPWVIAAYVFIVSNTNHSGYESPSLFIRQLCCGGRHSGVHPREHPWVIASHESQSHEPHCSATQKRESNL